MSASNQTHDHHLIKEWAEKREAVPAIIKGTDEEKSDGILLIHFPDKSPNNDNFKEITWDEFFGKFDENDLDLIYQDKGEW